MWQKLPSTGTRTCRRTHRLRALHDVGEADSHQAEAHACGHVPLRKRLAVSPRSPKRGADQTLCGRGRAVTHQCVKQRDWQQSLRKVARHARAGYRFRDPQGGAAQHARRQLPGRDGVRHREGIERLLIHLCPDQLADRCAGISRANDCNSKECEELCQVQRRTMLKAMLLAYLRATQDWISRYLPTESTTGARKCVYATGAKHTEEKRQELTRTRCTRRASACQTQHRWIAAVLLQAEMLPCPTHLRMMLSLLQRRMAPATACARLPA